MNKPLLALLILCSCTREAPLSTSCYTCTQWVLVTKPGCEPSTGQMTWQECNRTQSFIDSLTRRGTFVEYGVNGYRGESVTNCQLKSK